MWLRIGDTVAHNTRTLRFRCRPLSRARNAFLDLILGLTPQALRLRLLRRLFY